DFTTACTQVADDMARAFGTTPEIVIGATGVLGCERLHAGLRSQSIVVAQTELLYPFGSSAAAMAAQFARLTGDLRPHCCARLQRFAAMPAAMWGFGHDCASVSALRVPSTPTAHA